MNTKKMLLVATSAAMMFGSVATATPLDIKEASAVANDAAVASEATETLVGMPNPMVEYTSYRDMVETLGFSPLIFPRGTGLVTTAQYVIGGETADIRYQSRYGLNGRQQSYTVRTARATDTNTEPASISGLHGYTWETKKLSATDVQIAKISDSSYAAVWTTGGFIFSAYGQETNYWEFISTVQDNLVDLTEHYFAGRKKR